MRKEDITGSQIWRIQRVGATIMLLLARDHFADVGVNGIFVMMQQPVTSVPLS
jgi:hypothetical protein